MNVRRQEVHICKSSRTKKNPTVDDEELRNNAQCDDLVRVVVVVVVVFLVPTTRTLPLDHPEEERFSSSSRFCPPGESDPRPRAQDANR